MKMTLKTGSAAVWALLFLFVLTDSLFAQWNSDFYSSSIRPTLENQRSAEERTTSSRTSAAGAKHVSSNRDEKKSASDKTEAMLVSINQYNGAAGLPNLQGCNNDIRLMKKWLESNGTPASSISVFSDDRELSGQPPLFSVLQDELRRKSQARCKRLLIVFACHGISVGGKSFICPADAVDTDLSAIEGEGERAILSAGKMNRLLAVSEILKILKKAKADEVLLILDACRSSEGEDNFMREFSSLLSDNDKNFKKSNGGGFVVLTSCSNGQSALEIFSKEGDSHGAFLFYFIDGLSGRADYAACYDGKVTLVEAYNYAYSRVSDEAQRRNRRQTPEIFMSSNNGNMTLATYSSPPATERETDIQFLMRTGIILADNRWKKSDNMVGLKALDCVIDNVPNNTLAYALRGSIRRKLGDYGEALSDLDQIGEKFQLYANISSDERNALKKNPDADSESTDAVIKNNALLTISKSQGDYFFVRELNNELLGDSAGWIHRNNVAWSRTRANETITATRMQQNVRSVNQPVSSNSVFSPGGMIKPGNVIGGGGGTVSAPGPVYH